MEKQARQSEGASAPSHSPWEGWREVSRDEFFARMNPLDVHPSVRGNYHDPLYGSDWNLHGWRDRTIGRDLKVGPHAHYKPDSRYFLPCEVAS